MGKKSQREIFMLVLEAIVETRLTWDRKSNKTWVVKQIQLNLGLTNWLGPTNSFVKSKQFVKSNTNFVKRIGIKMSMQNTLRYTDMKKEWLLILE